MKTRECFHSGLDGRSMCRCAGPALWEGEYVTAIPPKKAGPPAAQCESLSVDGREIRGEFYKPSGRGNYERKTRKGRMQRGNKGGRERRNSREKGNKKTQKSSINLFGPPPLHANPSVHLPITPPVTLALARDSSPRLFFFFWRF